MSDPLYLCLNFSGAASLIYYKSSSVSSLQCFQELEINLNFNKNRPLFRNPFFSRNFSIPLFMLQGACAAFRAPVYNKTARLVGWRKYISPDSPGLTRAIFSEHWSTMILSPQTWTLQGRYLFMNRKLSFPQYAKSSLPISTPELVIFFSFALPVLQLVEHCRKWLPNPGAHYSWAGLLGLPNRTLHPGLLSRSFWPILAEVLFLWLKEFFCGYSCCSSVFCGRVASWWIYVCPWWGFTGNLVLRAFLFF